MANTHGQMMTAQDLIILQVFENLVNKELRGEEAHGSQHCKEGEADAEGVRKVKEGLKEPKHPREQERGLVVVLIQKNQEEEEGLTLFGQRNSRLHRGKRRRRSTHST